jgi:hypothetical protein
LITKTRPETVKALQDIVKECDSGVVLQMQKFGKGGSQPLRSITLTVLSLL